MHVHQIRDWEEEIDAWKGASRHPFPLPSLTIDEHA